MPHLLDVIGDTMTLWSKFTAWLSGWPESKERKKEVELAYLFEEEKKLERIRKGKKPKGLDPKKKTFWKHGDKND